MKKQSNIKNKALIVSAGAIGACAIILAQGLVIADSNCTATRSKPTVKSEAIAESPIWLTDYAAAKEQALKENKALLLNFTGSDWCPWCIKLDHEVFASAAFQDYARQHLVLVKVDFPSRRELPAAERQQNEQLAARFGIEGFPTVIVLSSREKPLGTLGYTRGGAEEFVSQLAETIARGHSES